MEEPSDATPDFSGDLPVPPAAGSDPVTVDAPRLRLRPLWLGFALTVAGFLLFAFAARSAGATEARSLAETCALPALIYYFMMVHRVVRVLDAQPGWSVAHTPAATVWKHFIPIYGVYFLYRWPGDVESYVTWRLGRRSWFALWTFLGLMAGVCLRYFDSFVGLLLMMTSLCFVYVPLKRALDVGSPTEESSSKHRGTLGLR